jgi:DNA-binding PadR family transcriptional regulator
MFGYEIKQVMDGSTSFFWQAKLSQIYQTVKVLEEEGMVVSEMETQTEKPDRKRYTITPKGQEKFFSELNTPLKEISPKKDDLLLKLFFSASKPKKEIQSELLYMKKLHEQQLKVYQTETKEIIQNAKKNHKSKTMLHSVKEMEEYWNILKKVEKKDSKMNYLLHNMRMSICELG